MILILISLLVVLYIMYWLRVMEGKFAQPRAVRCQRYPRNRQWEEFFDEEESSEQQTATDPPPLADVSPPMASLNIQDAIDFSDVYVTEQSKDEVLREDQDKQQIQTINDRFRAAKRNIVEFKMKNGVYTNKQRRQLVESLLRRAPCGRRIRSWRTENSDFLRGDVRPKANSQSGNLIRSAKNNPDIDLHPGALGPMAGLQGQWLSEENLPGNIFADMEAAGE